MSQAFRCDGCRDFFSGMPAFEGDVQGSTVTIPGDGYYIRPRHKGGVDDYNPVGSVDLQVEWPRALLKSRFSLCADCFASGLLPAIHDVIHDKEER